MNAVANDVVDLALNAWQVELALCGEWGDNSGEDACELLSGHGVLLIYRGMNFQVFGCLGDCR